MKLAILGYGKMGKAIEGIAQKRGHEIVLRISSTNLHELTDANLKKADIAIEFSNPESAEQNVRMCIDAGVNVICGSTGWGDALPEVRRLAQEKGVGFLHATNFSVGVNIFFEVNKLLASLMNEWNEYDVAVEETHHVHKKDAPGGTAITITEQIIDNLVRKNAWKLNGDSSDDVIPVTAHRIDEVPGTHKVTYSSQIDSIDIIHTAHSREGFAKGAVLAAEFINGKSGIFTMKDVLGIS